ncbi:C3 and PZP-like alpha-2-macroglobulin domain-containing protein 8 [Eumeta japonica]|uniref:C3 and PZP-like alpha-2-macroglobulin domain-containing protein 8 n=1 Tax=Eumeta variegata TaxID=151549 RepID=A0A4C1W521_EUMVA|nr:C3 and PZP-like alpha-2-macroglobulin domain-containing protein 8 [Eumeta japonica]
MVNCNNLANNRLPTVLNSWAQQAPRDLQTEDKLQYNFFPVTSGSIQFRVRAPNDAHIALTTGPQESDPMYEIFIGGWGNTKSVIRRNRTKPDKVEIETPNVLNGGEFRGFWVRWDGGVVSAGRENEALPFISWQDPDPFPVSFIGFCTGWGASGTWKVEDGQEFSTPDKIEYLFRPVMNGMLELEFRGPHDCHVCLTRAPADVDPVYEIMIGGWQNTQSVIRHNRAKPDKVTAPTPGIADPNEFKKFLIQWNNGRLLVRDGATGQTFMEWTDPAPFPVTHFGVRTGWGARGQWRIKHFWRSPTDPQPLGPSAPPAALYAAPPGYPNAQPSGYPGVPPPGYPRAPPGNAVWVDSSNGQVPPGANPAGRDVSGEELFIARAQHEGAMLPGKLARSHGMAYVPWGGQEHGKPQYQVLVGGSNRWVPTSGANLPPGALPAGESEDGEPLYVGRVNHEGSLTIGKVQQSHGVCYIPYGGQELGFQEYELLMS